MTPSLLQAFMDQLMNLLLAAMPIIIAGITAMAVIHSVPRISRWGFSNVLAFFGNTKEKNQNHIPHSNVDQTYSETDEPHAHNLDNEKIHHEFSEHESTDQDDDENEPISRKEAA